MSLHGKIKSVYCENFISYDVCKFESGECLNIIVGPNGSGKSTILAAIVIGLGGHPNLLGKSSNLDDYIKNGKQYSVIQLELYTERLQSNKKRLRGSITLSRKFTKSDQSKWMINGKPVAKNVFLNQVATFYIQLNNLCHLLPQERVQDFTRMNAQELFLNTITSVCKPDISTKFGMLKDLQEQRETGNSSAKNLKQKLDEKEQRFEQLNSVVQNIHSYKDMKEKIDICKVKILQQEIIRINNKVQEHWQQIFDNEKHIAKLIDEYSIMIEKHCSIENAKAQITKNIRQTEDRISQSIHNLENNKKEIAKSRNGIMREQSKFFDNKRGRAEKELEIKTRLLILRGCQQDLKDLNEMYTQKDFDDIHKSIENSKNTIKELNKSYSELKQELESYNTEEESIKRHLLALRNIPEQKLLLLENEYSDVHKAVEWLDSHRHLFEKHIYKPLMIELNVCNLDNAQYLENVIGLQNILAFVCMCKTDMTILIKELCENRNLVINVGLMEDCDDESFEPNIPIEQLRKYGFKSYLIDEVKGPPALLNYLCFNFNIQNIPFGNESVKDLSDEIPSKITSYFAGCFCFRVFVTEYSDEKCLMQAKVESLGLFSCIDDKEIDMYAMRLHNLNNKMDSLKKHCLIAESDLQEHELIFGEQMKKANELRSLKLQIKAKEQEVQKREKEYQELNDNLPGVGNLASELQTKISCHINEIIKQELAAVQALECFSQDCSCGLLFDEQKHLAQQQLFNASQELKTFDEKKKMLQDAIEQANKDINDLKQKRKEKEAEMISLHEQCNLDDNNSSQYAFYSDLTDDVVKLADIISDYNGRIGCLDSNDIAAITEYDTVKEEINRLQEIVCKNVRSNENIDAEIQSIYRNWMPTIQQVIADINKNFSKLMQSVSYVGEVRLGRNHELDFQSFGIEILVQFRKDMPLQILYKSTQSGGEQSISIAAYILAMQQLAVVPFRCVDEINQGMDPNNERKIFNMLVNITIEQNQAEYFYITPKLLSNLNSHDKMTVHIAYNGRVTSQVFN